MVAKKTESKYQQFLYNLAPNRIPYDRKVYEEITPYIKEELWKHMDKDRVKKAVFVLDDPLMEYGNDTVILKQVLKNFLPKVKKILNIDEQHQLKDQLKSKVQSKELIDRNIKQQIDLYINNKHTSGGIVEILQEGPKKGYIDLTQPHTKNIVSKEVPDTQKSIIANLMILMILEEELTKNDKGNTKKIVHHLDVE